MSIQLAAPPTGSATGHPVQRLQARITGSIDEGADVVETFAGPATVVRLSAPVGSRSRRCLTLVQRCGNFPLASSPRNVEEVL